MSRNARTISESGVYHILFRGVNQQDIFEEDADFKKLKETIAVVKQGLFGDIKSYQKMYVPKWSYAVARIKERTDAGGLVVLQ